MLHHPSGADGHSCGWSLLFWTGTGVKHARGHLAMVFVLTEEAGFNANPSSIG